MTTTTTISPPAKVCVVDDDEAVRKSLTRLLRAEGFHSLSFASPQAYLEKCEAETPDCLVLDVSMPGLDGLELQEVLIETGCECSIVFVTGHGDVPLSVRAMKAGAVDFLTKPVDREQLLAAVRTAVEKDRQSRQERDELHSIQQRLATLTSREREVLEHVVRGQLNKQIAVELGTVEKTVKVHRGRVMEKMCVDSVAELVRVAGIAGIVTGSARQRG